MDLNTFFDYLKISADSPSGLIWIKDSIDKNNRVNAKSGDIVGSAPNDYSYYRFSLCDNRLYNHRVIWMMHNNSNIPKDLVIDHIDRNHQNNDISNLRLVTKSLNILNNSHKTGKTGIRGVYIMKDRYVISSWILGGVRGHSTTFGIEKYGLELALQLAKSARDEAINKYVGKCDV